MILSIDTSSAACSVALLAPGGAVVARADEQIGRGHAERLAPMIAELLGGHVPTQILVGVGPGSFTGIRVGIGAAHGLAIGWSVPVAGMDSLALVAAASGQQSAHPIAVAMHGGHGELFVRTFDGATLNPIDELASLRPGEAAARIDAALVVGTGAEALVAARGSGKAIEQWPSAAAALSLPEPLRSLEARPSYGRAADAKARAAA